MNGVGAQVRKLVRIVADDPGLPRNVRSEAAELMEIATSQPRLARHRLEKLWASARPLVDLKMAPPLVDYVRCVSVETFWRHHLRTERKVIFGRDPKTYIKHLEAASNPEATIRSDLSNDPILLPKAHSWLVPASNIAGVDGRALVRRLQLGNSQPPFVVFGFPLKQLLAENVTVRKPRGIDAVPESHVQWSPSGVPDECIDQDVPLSALGWVQWQP